MNKNLIYSAFFVILGLLTFGACQDEPEFPDPGFELDDQDVEVRRDTADVYTVSMKMDVPNGVDHIEVLDATTYDLIETVEDYGGKHNFVFTYDIDLTSINEDSTLYYIFKVVDKNDRTTNRGFTLNVKGFSFPELYLVGGTSLNVVVPVYDLKGLVTTGLNELASITITFKDEEQFSYVVPEDTAIYEYILSEQVGFGTLLSGQEYSMNIIISDRKGQTSITEVKVRKSEGLKLPTSITQTNYASVVSTLYLYYDELNRINKIHYVWASGTQRTYYLSYNDLGVVDTLSLRTGDESDAAYTFKSQLFIYKEGTTQLDRILRYDYSVDESGSIEITTDHEVESQNFQYDEEGVLTSFYGIASTITMEYADPFNIGEAVFMDYWGSYDYNEIPDKHRQHRTGFQPIYMPSYIDGLPPFSTLYSIDNDLFCKVFYNKYVFTGTEAISPEYTGGLAEPNYSYETDAEGNVTIIREKFLRFGWKESNNVYVFEY